MTTYFISDPEGHDIMTNGFKLGEDDSLYILGDLTDSTVSPGVPLASLDKFLELKSFNLRNIMRVVADKRIHLIFGNRDLNKIRCIALNKLTNAANDQIVAEYNDGSIDLSEEKY
jgi:UDP-2,3-diacylglucosamine pyrophosphatase LpxH